MIITARAALEMSMRLKDASMTGEKRKSWFFMPNPFVADRCLPTSE